MEYIFTTWRCRLSPILLLFFTFVLFVVHFCDDVHALYVSYETLNLYKVGDRVPITVDKLTSLVTFAPVDYTNVPLCLSTESLPIESSNNNDNQWNQAITALHGDAYHNVTDVISIQFGYDVYCAPLLCSSSLSPTTTGTLVEDNIMRQQYTKYIQNDYYYNIYVDGLSAAYQSETDETVSVMYWGGIPIGEYVEQLDPTTNVRYNLTLESNDNNNNNNNNNNNIIMINNHWNFQIWYRPSKHNEELYSIVRIIVQPFSVQQESTAGKKLPSCDTANPSQTTNPIHTNYDMVSEFPFQSLNYEQQQSIQFTYDVIWIEAPDDVPYHKRWDIYLNMDDAIPNYVEFAGFFLGGFLLVSMAGILLTWVLRDLSYKPIIDYNDDEEVVVDAVEMEDCAEASTDDANSASQQIEIQMWPLSNRIFFPPTRARLLLCIACGTGAQLLSTAFSFIVLFRVGIINQSQGAGILTPGLILFCLSSIVGGYATARLYAIFHGDFKVALVASLVTAIAYPLLGLFVVYIVYDILPLSDAPDYNASAEISPLIILWICFIWPMTVVGGYFGYRGGSIQNFPVSEGSAGYHDLNLQNDDKKDSGGEMKKRWLAWKEFTIKYRIAILLSTGGFLPILSCFVNYSYGIAGPTFLRYYSVRPYMILSFVIFTLLSGTEAVLLFYRQIRTQSTYEWWWATFSVAGSAGIYIFALSMSYILFRGKESNLSGFTVLSYMIWFAFTSFGVLLMTGFMGVAMNIIFIRTLYTFIMNRQQ